MYFIGHLFRTFLEYHKDESFVYFLYVPLPGSSIFLMIDVYSLVFTISARSSTKIRENYFRNIQPLTARKQSSPFGIIWQDPLMQRQFSSWDPFPLYHPKWLFDFTVSCWDRFHCFRTLKYSLNPIRSSTSSSSWGKQVTRTVIYCLNPAVVNYI